VAASLHNLGLVARRMEDFEKARDLLEQALELKLEIGSGTGWLASTIFELGQLASNQGLADEADRRHRTALEIRLRVSPRHPEIAESLIGLGNVARFRGDLAEAERLWREAIGIIENRRRRMQLTPEAQSRFGAMYDSVHGSLARLLVETGRVGEAWDALEEARAAHLRSIVAHRESAPLSIPSELWFAKTRAETFMARVESRLARIDPTRDEAIAVRYRTQLAEAEEELEGIGHRIHEAAPRLADLGAPQAISLARLRELLHPGTVVIAYDVGDATTMALVTGAEMDDGPVVRWFQAQTGELELLGRVERFNALIARGRTIGTVEPALMAQAGRLSELLLDPAADLIASAQRVLIVPDGPLHELPFAALVLPGGKGDFLGHAKPLFVNPSASLAVELGARSADRDNQAMTIAAFGDPQYSPDSPLVREHHLEPLPGSRAEIEAIRKLFGDHARLFVGGAATEDSFKAHVGGSSVLHCAVHARVDPRVSMDSTLFFSTPADPDHSAENGALSAWEIAESLQLDTRLVVLSSCSTARGRIVPGEGIIGLARAFQVAGARTTVVSQWAVPDGSTAELMVAFYEQLADGRSTVEALQLAQRVIGADPALAHPFHWASFQVTGDWR
jgi:CHAT domain-containing protein